MRQQNRKGQRNRPPPHPVQGEEEATVRQPTSILPRFPQNGNPLQEHIETFQASNRSRNLSEHTIVKYGSHLAAFSSWLKREDVHYLSEVTPKVLRDFLLWRAQRGDKPATQRSYTQVLKTFFTFLVDEDILKESDNPTRRLRNPRVATPPPKGLTDEQVQDLLQSFDKDRPTQYRDWIAVLLMLESGLRVGEVSQLKVSDIDFANSRISVIGKGDKFRFAYFGQEVGQELQDYLNGCHGHYLALKDQQSAPLFPVTSNNGRAQAISRKHLTALVRTKFEQIGIDGSGSCHRLRHTFGRILASNGINAFQLQRLLGHSTITMSMRYVSLSDQDIQEAHRKGSPMDRLALHG